jgi:hypothetical protein
MLNFVNGKVSSLMDHLIPDGLSHAATEFVETLKINSISEKSVRGRRVITKRRNIYGERAADLINFYFRMADLPIRFLSNVRQWRRWEANCFQMLNGDRFRASVRDARTVALDKLPGQSLWDHMKQGTLSKRMLEAAGREYRRAHQFWTDEFGAGWSHGDASMTNVVYDEKTNRARLVDFEIIHEKSLPARLRHADDLLVFLLDMVGRISSARWVPFATCFLRSYGDAIVINELRKQLVVPGGLALIWWNVRTNFTKSAKIDRRFKSLDRSITKLGLYRLAKTDRARQKRCHSRSCHVTSPGTPTVKSRNRVIKEIAKEASPGIPRRLPTTR